MNSVYGRTNPDYSGSSDEQLLSDFSRIRDPECIGELYRRYTHLVMGVCMKYLRDSEAAKDAVMQIFQQLLEKPADGAILNVKAWLFTVTRNHCLMQLRHEGSERKAREARMKELETELMESPGIMHLNDEEEHFLLERRLRMALEKLKPEQQKCLSLFYLEDRSYQEICELTGYDFGQVKSFLQNGKRNLKILMDHGHE